MLDRLGLAQKLIRHGATRASLLSLANTALNELERKTGRGHLRSNPDVVHIEPTTACNLGCKMCGRSTHWTDLVKNSAHMKRETFLRLVPFLRTARLAVLHGWGEPLLHPDLLWMIGICKRHGCMVTFHTNGLLLDREKSEALVDAGLDHITISIDGATPETYRAVRGAELDHLLDNLRTLDRIKAARRSRYPRITFKSVLMKRNLHELHALVELAGECGAEEIELNNLIVYHPSLEEQVLFDERREVESVVEDAMRKAETRGIRIFYGGVQEKDGIPACPFRNFTVTCDGTVGPCGAQRFAMGNIHDTPLRELWNHSALVEMRLGYARRELPTQCQRCPGRTNKKADHVQPELGYLEQTLQVRQWERTERFQAPRPPTIDPPRPPCNPSTPAAAGGCSTGGGCSS